MGGQATDDGEYPWQVCLETRGPENYILSFLKVGLLFGSSVIFQGCAGSLVSDRHVVTAAHCTDGKQASEIKVVIGDTNFALSTEAISFIRSIKTIKQHPGYASSTVTNDICVLELEEAVDLTRYPNIKPICLPAQGMTYANSDATVSGWGTLSFGGTLAAHLQEVDVTVFADGDCGAMNNYMTSDMICAGVREGGKDSCQGDSGGPLFTADAANNGAETLIGVVSWGFGCATAGQLGIYSEVAHFRSWLDAQLTDINTCSPPSTPAVSTATPSTPAPTSAPATSPAPVTTTGSNSGNGTCGNCVFPFTFANRVHYTCTTIDGDPRAWCSNTVDENGIGGLAAGQWEYCTDPSCPGVTSPAVIVNPSNAVGSCCK